MSSRATILFTVYLGYLVLFALAPFRFEITNSVSLVELYQNKFEGFSSVLDLSAWDIWTNVVLFMPYGAIILALPVLFVFPWWLQIFLASVSAGLLSFLLELGQLLVPRRPSLADVICNTLGAVIGAILSRLAYGRLTHGRERTVAQQCNAVPTFFLGGYIVILYGAFSVPLPFYFSNWDPDFPFQLGNEASLDRPWHGDLYLVAMYDRALTPKEVKTNFTAGPFTNSWNRRVHQSLVLLYDFSEGGGEIVHDRVSSGSPVHLRIRDPGHVRWLKPNGLALHGDTIIASLEPPMRLSSSRFSTVNELSVETWVVAANSFQNGPARIVSYSKDVNHRNFTLGQQQREIAFRLRTPVSGSNGTQPELKSADQPLRAVVQHLLVTFRDGIETLYVDGDEHGSAALQTKVGFIDVVVSLLGQEFKWPLWSVFIFPLGILSYLVHALGLHSRQVMWRSLVTSSAGVALIAGTRFEALKAADPVFVVIGAGSLLMSILIAPLLITGDYKPIDRR